MPCAIPWTAIYSYATYHDVDMDYLYNLISYMDREYLDYRAKEMKKNMSAAKTRGSRNGRR